MTLSLVAILSLAWAVDTEAAQPNMMPHWARGDWNGKDKIYRQILEDVRPYFGKFGFIDEKVVEEKWRYHFHQYMSYEGNPIYLMRILAWTEVALSDGYIFRSDDMKKLRTRLNVSLRMFNKPVDSYALVRTMAIVTGLSSSPDAYEESRLFEKLYIHDKTDTEIESVYILWCVFTQKNVPNRLTLQKLLEKQEKLEFRKGSRLDILALSYSQLSTYEGPSSKLMQRSVDLSMKRLKMLPKGHYGLTPEDQKRVRDGIAAQKKIIARWKKQGY